MNIIYFSVHFVDVVHLNHLLLFILQNFYTFINRFCCLICSPTLIFWMELMKMVILSLNLMSQKLKQLLSRRY